MSSLARAINWTGGGLLLLVALGFLMFVPNGIADYAREPENLWLGVGWIIGLCLFAALCFMNAAHAPTATTASANWLTGVNVVAVFALVILKALDTIYAYDDPVLTALLVLCAMGPISAVIAALHAARTKRA